MSHRDNNLSTTKKRRLYVALAVLVVLFIGGVVLAALFLRERPADTTISNFQQCKDAGGSIAESYPEQCMIDGKTFVNDEQASVGTGEEYVGMTEQEALGKAESEDIPARVVERDGESLPVTMDLMHGRLNFFVRDGEVFRVNVESIN